WGYLYRNFIHALARHQRCIVPDHMGMGKSGIPQEQYPYRLQHHIANFENLLLHLDLHDVTLVLHDWGGPVGLGFASRHPERVKRGLSRFLDTPTLLVWGMRDPVLSEPVLRTWQSIYPRAITYGIEDASHFLQEDAPARIVNCIGEFLEANHK